MRAAKRLAAVCGSVATGVLALSVVHCTQAISSLTGSHWLLSALLAIGIDAGMVVSEVAEVASHGTSAERTVGSAGPGGYTLAAIVLSMLLNGYAFGQHATGAVTYAAAALGLIIPGRWSTAWGAACGSSLEPQASNTHAGRFPSQSGPARPFAPVSRPVWALGCLSGLGQRAGAPQAIQPLFGRDRTMSSLSRGKRASGSSRYRPATWAEVVGQGPRRSDASANSPCRDALAGSRLLGLGTERYGQDDDCPVDRGRSRRRLPQLRKSMRLP